MNRNLFKKEMRMNLPNLIIWMAVIILLMSVTMSAYPIFLENQAKILDLMKLFPEGMLQFKGISNVNDLLSVFGFYTANNLIYMMVLGSVFSIVLSSNILLKEEYNNTAEYLLSRPISRSEVFLSKLAVIVLNIFLLNLVTAFAGFVSIELVKSGPFSIKAFLILSFNTMLLTYLFGALGLFISTLIRRAKPFTVFGIALVLIFYFIYNIAKIAESVAFIGYVSPFYYVDADAINPDPGVKIGTLAYFVGISVLLTALSYWIYKKKDIYT
ncbi:MAG: ABC transporter permease subunit [Bacteroidales bacterium]